METVKTFIKKLSALETCKSPHDKFRDFIEMAYCAHAKPTAPTKEQADALEERYMQIVGTYRDKDAVRAYPELLALMAIELQKECDFLGAVAGEIGALNSHQGQFFTPYDISRMMAEMLVGEKVIEIEESGYVTVDEPASGAGGMVLAFANTLRRRGYHPETQLFVRATDISAQCYWMTFLQLTLAGIPAQVIRGNSLSLETFESAWTPHAIPFLGFYGDIFGKKKQNQEVAPRALPSKPLQLALF